MPVELKNHPAHPQTKENTVEKYCAVWPKTVYQNEKPVQKQVGSGWRDDYEDAVTLAIRMNGYVMRGYFPAKEG